MYTIFQGQDFKIETTLGLSDDEEKKHNVRNKQSEDS